MGTGAGSLTGRRSDDYTGQRHTVKLEVIRVIDDDGKVVHPEREPALTGDDLRRLFRTMLLVRLLDERMLLLQRQGRMGFYLTSLGEEATHIGAAHALRDRRLALPRLPRDWCGALPRLPAQHLHVPALRQRRRSGEGAPDAGAPLGAAAELRLGQLAGRVAHPTRGGDRLGRQAAEDGGRRARLLRRRRDLDADLSRQAPPSPRCTRCRRSCFAATTAGPSRCPRRCRARPPRSPRRRSPTGCGAFSSTATICWP